MTAPEPLTLAEIVGDAPAFAAVSVASPFDVVGIRCDGDYWLLVDVDSRDHEWHTLDELSELVEFARPLHQEQLPVARDDAAELRAAVKAFVDKHFHGGSKANRHDYVTMVPAADVFALVEALRAALAASEGSES